jgi:hypothetical protein
MVRILGVSHAGSQNTAEEKCERPNYGVLLRLLRRRTDSRFQCESPHKSCLPETIVREKQPTSATAEDLVIAEEDDPGTSQAAMLEPELPVAGWSIASRWEAGLLEPRANEACAGEQRVQVSPGPLLVSRPRYPALDAVLGTPTLPEAPFRRTEQEARRTNVPLACVKTISSQLAGVAGLRLAAFLQQGHCLQRGRRQLKVAQDPIPVRQPRCPRLETGVGTPALPRLAALPIPLLGRGVTPHPALPPAKVGLTPIAWQPPSEEQIVRGRPPILNRLDRAVAGWRQAEPRRPSPTHWLSLVRKQAGQALYAAGRWPVGPAGTAGGMLDEYLYRGLGHG